MLEKKVSDLTASEFINAVAESVAERLKPDNYLCAKEVIERFHISRPTYHKWVKKGLLKPSHIGGRTLYLESELRQIPTDQKGKHFKAEEGSRV